MRPPPTSTLFPYTTLFRSAGDRVEGIEFPEADEAVNQYPICTLKAAPNPDAAQAFVDLVNSDRKSTRLNSSHVEISYAVFCLKKKNLTAHYQHERDSILTH